MGKRGVKNDTHSLAFVLWYNKKGASLVAQMVKNLSVMQETWVRSLGREDLLEEYMAIPSVFLTGESHGQPSELQPIGSQRVGHD